MNIDDTNQLDIPDNTLCFAPKTSTFTPWQNDSKHKDLSHIKVTRTGFDLSPAYAVTDYFIQGGTLPTHQVWFADFGIPPDNMIKKAMGYVTLTRYQGYDHLNTLEPLFKTDENGYISSDALRKTPIFDKYLRCIRNSSPDLDAQLALLTTLASQTHDRLKRLYLHLSSALGIPYNTPTALPPTAQRPSRKQVRLQLSDSEADALSDDD